MSEFFDDDNSMYRKFATYEEDRDDGEFLKSLYPMEIMELQLFVEEECDKLEYDGSIMFDQYPDKVRVRNIVQRIINRAEGIDRSLVEVLLINEMLRRRMRRRYCRARGFC